MSQRAFLAGFDAAAHAAFAAGGLADSGEYLPPGASTGTAATSCRVMVDRDVETIGEMQQRKAGRVEVSYLLADVTPEQGGKLLVDGDTYINADKISDDGSLSRWLVRRG